MIVVTGASGFIAGNAVAALTRRGHEVFSVDVRPRAPGETHYCDKDELLARWRDDPAWGRGIEAVFHEGACSSTVERDERYIMDNNFGYSRALLALCLRDGVPLQYASTAGVYGHNHDSTETPANEAPLTAYARSKLLFDQHVRELLPTAQSPVVGLRYFNVYGPGEGHKGFMRSTPLVFDEQLRRDGRARVFGANAVCAAGEHRRDFVHVDDVVAVKLWLLDNPVSGIYNIGTGQSRTFGEVAETVLRYHGRGTIEYTPFPPELGEAYQNYTEARLDALRAAGYQERFMPIEEGIPRYLDWLATERAQAAAS